jgi:hypothetical protein
VINPAISSNVSKQSDTKQVLQRQDLIPFWHIYSSHPSGYSVNHLSPANAIESLTVFSFWDTFRNFYHLFVVS